MYLRVFIFLLLLKPLLTYSQNWQDIGGIGNWDIYCFYEDTLEDVLYIGGNFYTAGGDTIPGIAKWDGHHFSSLGNGLDLGAFIFAITKYNGEIYVGGNHILIGGKQNYIAKYNGLNWDTLSSSVNGTVLCFKEINNELYVGGTFDSAGTVQTNSLAKWDGNTWSSVFDLPKFSLWNSNYVLAVEFYKGELYVGGNFGSYDSYDSLMDITKYNGTLWVKVGGSMHGGMSGLEDMVVYKNELYISGIFYFQDGNAGNFIQRWNGSEWKDVGGGTLGLSGMLSDNGQIHDMKIHNNELYIGGVFSYAGGVPAKYIAKWDGSRWCSLGGNFNNRIKAIGWCKDTLYIGGNFKIIDGDSILRIAKWIGGNYLDTCSQVFSVPEISNETGINIYPNPATTYFTIKTENNKSQRKAVNIYSIEGRFLKQVQFENSEIEIMTNDFSNGIYIVELLTGSEPFYKKVVINK